MWNISSKVLSKLPFPKGAPFGPSINGKYDGDDIEFVEPSYSDHCWYGLMRVSGTQYHFWRKLSLTERDLDDLRCQPHDTKDDIQRSFNLACHPRCVSKSEVQFDDERK